MTTEEDECDSSSLFPVASQSDVASFLHAQAAKITGLNSSITDDDDDDESLIDDNLLQSFPQNRKSRSRKSFLSHSCFASISSQKTSHADDLTELKWLNTFKFKEFQDNKNNNNEQISKLSNELKSYHEKDLNLSFGVAIFLALYSKHDDKQIPWSLTMKQLYEYIQTNMKYLTNKRGWKNLFKQTLLTIPCFIKTKHDVPKSRSIWTVDPYYRPLLTKAYLTGLSSSPVHKITSESIVDNFAPKATVKAKVLPRLYERLCGEKVNEQVKSNLDHKRPRSASSTEQPHNIKNNDEKRLLSSGKKLTKRNSSPSNKESISIILNTKKPIEPSIDESDEPDSNSSIRKSIITTRSQTATRNLKNSFVHRRKSSPPKKHLSHGLLTHRPNTRINKKNIEQDLELLRQAQPLDLSSNEIQLTSTTNNNNLPD